MDPQPARSNDNDGSAERPRRATAGVTKPKLDPGVEALKPQWSPPAAAGAAGAAHQNPEQQPKKAEPDAALGGQGALPGQAEPSPRRMPGGLAASLSAPADTAALADSAVPQLLSAPSQQTTGQQTLPSGGGALAPALGGGGGGTAQLPSANQNRAQPARAPGANPRTLAPLP